VYFHRGGVGFVRVRVAALLVVVVFYFVPMAMLAHANAQAFDNLPVTVSDVISMTRIAGLADSSSFLGGAPTRGFASFSPDGRRFAFVLRKGNVKRNTNDYSLFVVETREVFRKASATLLLTFSSSSNREGIKEVIWLRDNDTILFLGENPSELTQLFEISCSRRKLKRLTTHPTNVTSYAVSENEERIVYAAEIPTRNLVNESVIHHGFYVPADVDLTELIAGHVSEGKSDGCELFVMKKGNIKYERLKVSGSLLFPVPDLSVSPDGKYSIVKTMVRNINPAWKEYDDPVLKRILATRLPKGSATFIWGYELVDIDTGSSKALIDAPVGDSGSEVIWSPDSQSVIVAGTYLPLDVPNQEEREARRARTCAVEVVISNAQINQITDEDLKLVGLDQGLKLWQFESRDSQDETNGPPRKVYFRKSPAGWERSDNVSGKDKQSEPTVFVDEDLNRPPQIVAEDPETKQRGVVFDLNPQFAAMSLGHVKEIRWSDTAGHEIIGALYLPPDYVQNKRYPLVIQTHGYRPHEFWIDGPYATAFVAQPLASRGIAVLQLPEVAAGTADEGERNVLAFESGIKYLDQQGIIDVNHVGLVGFSRTCYHVKYVLTHSKFHFGAASITDGVDAGYFQFATFANEAPNVAADAKMLVGAAPFGKGLSIWMNNSPGFLLDRVETPILIEATRPTSLMSEWEWFSGLSQLGKPVELLYLPTGAHVLEKPWDRLTSLQSNLDWFVFWLKGEEDPDPTKAGQYKRWRDLRELRQRNSRLLPNAHPISVNLAPRASSSAR
jgi:dipeptidyl aminopeptidase/acylaminoacyl peptidase